MKKLLLYILLIFISNAAAGQFPISQSQGSPTTQVFSRGAYGSDSGFVYRTNFADTATANLSFLKNIPGIQIRIGDGNWQRSQAANRWIQQVTMSNISTILGCYGLQKGGIVTWSGTGYIMDVSMASYFINCNFYTSAQAQVTLAASHPTLNRIDVIYVNTSGQVGVLTGVPGVTPTKPQVNPSTQLELTFINVDAASTEPGGVTQTIIYDENLGNPTEWAYTSGLETGTSNPASINNPFHLTINNLISSGATGLITWTAAAPVTVSNYTTLKLYVRLEIPSSPVKTFINVFLSSSGLSSAATLNILDYGFNPDVIGSYQLITIPIQDFAYGAITFDGISFNVSTSSQVHFDYIQLQGGIPTGSSPYITDVFRKTGTDSVFQVKNGVAVFAFKDSTGGGGATPTWQQTLTAGSTLTTNNSINVNTNSLTFNNGSGYTFNWNQGGNSSYLTGSTDYFEALLENGSVGGSMNMTPVRMQLLKYRSGGRSDITMSADSITLNPHLGQLNIDTLRSWSAVADTTFKKPMTWDTRNGRWERASSWFGSGGGGSTALSALTAATGTNTIDNVDHTQTWHWNSLTSGRGMIMGSNTTGATGSNSGILKVARSGTHAASSVTTYALEVENNNDGTASTNIGLRVDALGATTNNAIVTGSGNNLFNQASGSVQIGLAGTNLGILKMSGNTSGTVTLQPAAAAGTYTLTLPTTDGNSGEFLQTNGSGVLTWAAASGGSGITVGTTTITSGTNTRILYNNSGVVGEYLVTGTGTTAVLSTSPGFTTAANPVSNDGAALGTTALQWSDLFLAEGGVINWDNGDVTLTQTGDNLKVDGGDFEIFSSTGGKIIFSQSGSSGSIQKNNGTDGLWIRPTSSSLPVAYIQKESLVGTGDLIWGGYTNSSSANVIIDAYGSGDLYLQTRDPLSAGNININAVGTVIVNSTGISSDFQVKGATEDNLIYLDASTDRVGIGTNAPAVQFHVTGAVRLAGIGGAGAVQSDADGDLSVVSDGRLKNLISSYDLGLKEVLQISPVLWEWKHKPGQTYAGFDALQVYNVAGEFAAPTNKEGYHGLQDRALIAMLINSVKDLQKQIDELKQNKK